MGPAPCGPVPSNPGMPNTSIFNFMMYEKLSASPAAALALTSTLAPASADTLTPASANTPALTLTYGAVRPAAAHASSCCRSLTFRTSSISSSHIMTSFDSIAA